MKIRPMNGRVVVRPVESSEQTKGGIVIPDTAKEKPREGEIVAVTVVLPAPPDSAPTTRGPLAVVATDSS